MRISALNIRRERAEEWTAIEAEAARLYLKAKKTESEADWQEAYDWVEANPAHGYAFAKIETSWELTGRLSESRMPVDPEEVAGPAGRFEALFSRRAVTGLIAATLVAVVSTVAIQKWMAVERYRTEVGQARLLILADGSKVRLNTDSSVEVAWRPEQRLVRLLQGEARFDVAHNPDRPFIVQAGDVSFRALGTAFNVRFKRELMELTVISGRVAVNEGGEQKATVAAGGYAAVSGGTVGVTRLTSGEVARRTAWEQGTIDFDGETLEQAVAEFNRYRSKPLIIGSPQIASLRVGGTFKASGSDLFVESLAHSFGIRAIPAEDGILLMPGEEEDSEHPETSQIPNSAP